MPLVISAKNFQITPSQKDYVTKKMKKTNRMFDKIRTARVELDHDHHQRTGLVYRAEMSLELPGQVIKAGQKAEHLNEAIDLCIDKLLVQLRKYKDKHQLKQNVRPDKQ